MNFFRWLIKVTLKMGQVVEQQFQASEPSGRRPVNLKNPVPKGAPVTFLWHLKFTYVII